MVDIHIHHYHAAAAIKVLELHNKDYGAQVKPQKKTPSTHTTRTIISYLQHTFITTRYYNHAHRKMLLLFLTMLPRPWHHVRS